MYGLQTPVKRTYSFLPFSDWYFEVTSPTVIPNLVSWLTHLLSGANFEARVLVNESKRTAVSSYRMKASNPDTRMRMLSKTTRRYTKHSLSNGLTAETVGLSGVDRFYRLHTLTRKKHGLPVQPKKFFRIIMKTMKHARITICMNDNGHDVGAFLLLADTQTLYYKYGASNPKYLELRPNHYLFYILHDIAIDNDLKAIDLGRTDEEGLHNYKASLGASPFPILRISSRGVLPDTNRPNSICFLRQVMRALPIQILESFGGKIYKYLA